MLSKRSIYFRRYLWLKKRLKNKNFSLISNNCIGGIIYNDLGLKFTSPTINLYFYAPDYIRFVSNLKYNLSLELKEAENSKYLDQLPNYPIGKLEEIEIHFNHYLNFKEAKDKWEERLKRINWNNLFIIGSDRDGCTKELIYEFSKIPYKKVFFTSRQDIKDENVVYISKYKGQDQVGDMIKDNKLWINYFDLIHWLNTGRIIKYSPAKIFLLTKITDILHNPNKK